MEMRFVIPRVPFPARLVMLTGFAILGFALQVLVLGGISVFFGAVLMVPGLIFVSARGFRNKPMDVGGEDWQPASVREFDRIKSNLQLTRQKGFSVIYRAGFGWFVACVLAAGSLVLVMRDMPFAALVTFDALVLLVPFLLTGNVKLWTPSELAFRMRVFDPILSTEQAEGGETIITPYLKLDKDKEGHEVPEDIRLMVEPRRKPADFLGVQLQVAVNKGPNGSVPYMYAVFLCRGKGATFQKLSASEYGGFLKEPGGDKEYGYVVVRQKTSGTGYHTTDADVRRLYQLVKEKVLSMSA
jgi:hypothetical protein